MKKFLKIALFTMMMVCMFAMTTKMDSNAATNVNKKLQFGTTYKDYDVTGNGKKDTLKIARIKTDYDDFYQGVKVTINGKSQSIYRNSAYEYGYSYGYEVRLMRLQNGKCFISIDGQGNNGDDCHEGIYQYKSGKLTRVIDMGYYTRKHGYHHNCRVKKVSGNSITVEIGSMSFAIAGIKAQFVYKYDASAKKLKRSLSYGKVTERSYKFRCGSDYGKLRKTMTLYSDAACTKKIGTVSVNTSATVTHMYATLKAMNFKIKTKAGKTGWVKGNCASYDESKLIFKECIYAG